MAQRGGSVLARAALLFEARAFRRAVGQLRLLDESQLSSHMLLSVRLLRAFCRAKLGEVEESVRNLAGAFHIAPRLAYWRSFWMFMRTLGRTSSQRRGIVARLYRPRYHPILVLAMLHGLEGAGVWIDEIPAVGKGNLAEVRRAYGTLPHASSRLLDFLTEPWFRSDPAEAPLARYVRLRRAVRIRPDLGVPHYMLGLTAWDMGRNQEALRNLTLAQQRLQEREGSYKRLSATIGFWLAVALARIPRYLDKALSLVKSLPQDHGRLHADRLAIVWLAAGRPDRARSLAASGTDHPPPDWLGLYIDGRLALHEGRPRRALALLASALAAGDTIRMQPRFWTARCHLALGERARALEILEDLRANRADGEWDGKPLEHWLRLAGAPR